MINFNLLFYSDNTYGIFYISYVRNKLFNCCILLLQWTLPFVPNIYIYLYLSLSRTSKLLKSKTELLYIESKTRLNYHIKKKDI